MGTVPQITMACKSKGNQRVFRASKKRSDTKMLLHQVKSRDISNAKASIDHPAIARVSRTGASIVAKLA